MLADIRCARAKANLTKPVVHPEIWQEIPDCQVRPAISPTNEEQNRPRNQETEIRQQDQMLILLLIERASRIEMVDATIAVLPTDALAFRLLVMVVVARNI